MLLSDIFTPGYDDAIIHGRLSVGRTTQELVVRLCATVCHYVLPYTARCNL